MRGRGAWASRSARFLGWRAPRQREEEELLTMSFSRTEVHDWILLSCTETVCLSVCVCVGWALRLHQQSDRQLHPTSFLFLSREERVAVFGLCNTVPVCLDSLCLTPQSCVLYSLLASSRLSRSICWKFSSIMYFDAWHLTTLYSHVIVLLTWRSTQIREPESSWGVENPW